MKMCLFSCTVFPLQMVCFLQNLKLSNAAITLFSICSLLVRSGSFIYDVYLGLKDWKPKQANNYRCVCIKQIFMNLTCYRLIYESLVLPCRSYVERIILYRDQKLTLIQLSKCLKTTVLNLSRFLKLLQILHQDNQSLCTELVIHKLCFKQSYRIAENKKRKECYYYYYFPLLYNFRRRLKINYLISMSQMIPKNFK